MDCHLEPLTFALSSETNEKVMPQIKLDYIGQWETIDQDWKELIHLANSRDAVPTIEFAPLSYREAGSGRQRDGEKGPVVADHDC